LIQKYIKSISFGDLPEKTHTRDPGRKRGKPAVRPPAENGTQEKEREPKPSFPPWGSEKSHEFESNHRESKRFRKNESEKF
jgi:hypothetical protein